MAYEYHCRACGAKCEKAESPCPSCGSVALSRVWIRQRLVTGRMLFGALVVGFPIILILISIPLTLLAVFSFEVFMAPIVFFYFAYFIYAIPVIVLFQKMDWPPILMNVSGAMIPGINGWWAVGMVALTYASFLVVMFVLIQSLRWIFGRVVSKWSRVGSSS